MPKKKTTKVKADRKSIGVCAHCGEPAYRWELTVTKLNGREVEVKAPYCYRHAQVIRRRRLKGLSPEVKYDRASRRDWSDDDLKQVQQLKAAGLTLRQMGKALGISHTHAAEKLKEADERLGNS